MIDYKLVANMSAGKYQPGDEVTDEEEIAKLLDGELRHRFNKVAIHPGDIPHEPVQNEPTNDSTIES